MTLIPKWVVAIVACGISIGAATRDPKPGRSNRFRRPASLGDLRSAPYSGVPHVQSLNSFFKFNKRASTTLCSEIHCTNDPVIDGSFHPVPCPAHCEQQCRHEPHRVLLHDPASAAWTNINYGVCRDPAHIMPPKQRLSSKSLSNLAAFGDRKSAEREPKTKEKQGQSLVEKMQGLSLNERQPGQQSHIPPLALDRISEISSQDHASSSRHQLGKSQDTDRATEGLASSYSPREKHIHRPESSESGLESGMGTSSQVGPDTGNSHDEGAGHDDNNEQGKGNVPRRPSQQRIEDLRRTSSLQRLLAEAQGADPAQ